MSPHKTHYDVLGLHRNATLAEVKKRFREIVRKHHPDVAGDRAMTPAEFARITEAYKVLSNPTARRSYDATLPSVTQRAEPPKTHQLHREQRCGLT